MHKDLPTYDELLSRQDAPPGSSWGLWGQGDVLGCLNLIDRAATARGVASVLSHDVFALNLAMEQPDPPLFSRPRMTHEVTWLDGEAGHDDALLNWNTQSSSQWDGFRHIRHPVHGFYNGVADDDHGMHHWAQRGIATRAVLCDVGRFLASRGESIAYDTAQWIEPSVIFDTLEEQGSQVAPGDVLLIRTGWLEWYLEQNEDVRRDLAERTRAPGLAPGAPTARILWDLHVAAVAADNPAVEAYPSSAHFSGDQIRAFVSAGRFEEFFVHFALLPLLGLPLGEFFALGDFAAACAQDRRYEALLTSAPLNLQSGVASPPNAIVMR